MDDIQRLQFEFLFAVIVTPCDNVFQEFHEGLIDPSVLEQRFVGALNLLRLPGGRLWWQRNRLSYFPEMRQFIDARLEAAEPE